MNTFMSALKNDTNYKHTENCAVARKSTLNAVYDMFAFGAAYRNRTEEDCILLFKNAFEEDPVYALKCLFYMRDVRGGAGERRFFRTCAKWLATEHADAMKRNLQYVPEFGRWDDLYIFVGTPLEKDVFRLIKRQLVLDMQSKTPSLLAKWLKSENTSSPESRKLGDLTRYYLNMTHREYRKTLSILRERINVLERLMSAGRWDEIVFDKIPSKAGLIYKNAFARRDIIKAKYEAFAKDKNTKVNAKTLFPYEVVTQAHNLRYGDTTNRAMVNKYWENLENVFNDEYTLNAMAIVDTSGSMTYNSGSMTCTSGSMTWGNSSIIPIDIAISLGLYCAEKAHGPFHGHYISFSRQPRLIATEGVDFVDKVNRIYRANLCENTNLEAAFDLVLDTARRHHMKQSDLPEALVVISDMEIDAARANNHSYDYFYKKCAPIKTSMDLIREKWDRAGYKMPKLIYWNCEARNNTILDDGPNVTYVSGASPSIFKQIMTGKTGIDLMYAALDAERYACIR